MAIKDRAVTIKGADVVVTLLQVAPHPRTPGDVVIIVDGQARDSEGRAVALKSAEIVYRPGQADLVATLMTEGLNALRKMNGFEDAAITLEPKLAAVAVAEVEKPVTP